MSPRRLTELTPAERRRAWLWLVLRCVLSVAVIVALYYLLPLEGNALDGDAVIGLVAGGILFLAIMAWQLWRILHADLPQLRAVTALAVSGPLFLCIYATIYVTMSRFRPGSFNQHLDRTGALYFTVVTFGTVGYGDIAPESGTARLIVVSQILCDLIFLGVILRLFFGASRLTLKRRDNPSDPPSDPPSS